MPMNKAEISRVLGKLIFLSEMREKERKAKSEEALSSDESEAQSTKGFEAAVSRANS
jgi:hypothetical protein